MTDKEALDILNDPFLAEDLEEGYGCRGLAEAIGLAVRALAERIANAR